MYSGIKSRVVYNCNKTEYFACNVGISQVENIFPFLFSFYLNDLEQFLHDRNSKGLDSIAKDIEDELDIFLRLFILLYADDMVLFSDSAEDLQVQLNNFSEYCDTWKLKVNISKTKIVVFTRARLNHFNFSYKGSNLEIVKDYIYLGINFSSTGSYLNTKKKIVGKATKAMYEILKKG
jgi:hypothetical protein